MKLRAMSLLMALSNRAQAQINLTPKLTRREPFLGGYHRRRFGHTHFTSKSIMLHITLATSKSWTTLPILVNKVRNMLPRSNHNPPKIRIPKLQTIWLTITISSEIFYHKAPRNLFTAIQASHLARGVLYHLIVRTRQGIVKCLSPSRIRYGCDSGL